MNKILEIKNVKKYFPIKKGVFLKTVGHVKALESIDLDLYENETVGIVGESGCGKSTLGRVITKIHDATEGSIIYHDKNGVKKDIVGKLNKKENMIYRSDLQMVFQNPFDSLDPRMTIGDIISEPLQIHKIFKTKEEETNYVKDLLKKVGLYEEYISRYPHEFSGGQRQRIAVARAIALKPRVIICDEPTSALDVSVQSQVINLLKDIQKESSIAYLFISHNLDIVYHVSDKIVVMYLGHVVEEAKSEDLFENTKHPYTKILMSSMPGWNPKERKLSKVEVKGEPPSPINPPSGCPFHPRCPNRMDICSKQKPLLKGDDHKVACHLYNK
ncbi:ATP-binding cassette domain-containing protein [Oceanotoga sp. DSM 15011]|uniref:ABC transporter ATP-binding protein n=1 Tax=Oceanotoga sp. DSM 15011 TaxID=2984951 RepID=UPI0021F41CE7|nr:oligopeptide/dipeptide ABC transporter ATP-binding protein [Oceanotoga sp. DSM 15011]UYO99309.1 ATP-binding cassette domain-containing protein [Oceanotoga sp. DSM 15011]